MCEAIASCGKYYDTHTNHVEKIFFLVGDMGACTIILYRKPIFSSMVGGYYY